MPLTPKQRETIMRLSKLSKPDQVKAIERAKEIKRERKAKEIADTAIKEAAQRR